MFKMGLGLPGTKRMVRARETYRIRTASSVQNLKIYKKNQKIQKKASQITKIKMALMTQKAAKISVKRDWTGMRWKRRLREKTERG